MLNLFSIEYFLYLFLAFIIILALREFFAYKENIKMKYIFTPLVTTTIIGFVLLSIDTSGINSYKVLVLTSLIFALIADTLLMIVEVDLFKYGLIYFLLGHIIYIVAFSSGYYFQAWHIILGIILLFVISGIIFLIKNKTGSIDVPVLIYLLIISTMVFFALSRFNHGYSRSVLFIGIGAVVFMISDFLIAVNTFIHKIPHSTVITWALYAPSQCMIALSCFA